VPFAPGANASARETGPEARALKLSIAPTSAIIAAFVDFPIEARLPSMKIPVEALTELVSLVLARHGLSEGSAGVVARTIVAAERDGSRSHGLLRVAGYLSSLDCGTVGPMAISLEAALRSFAALRMTKGASAWFQASRSCSSARVDRMNGNGR